MKNTLTPSDLKRLAAAGVRAEIARLQSTLEELEGSPKRTVVGANSSRPGRRPLTAAERKAVSVRMKAMWAAKRAEKAEAGSKRKKG